MITQSTRSYHVEVGSLYKITDCFQSNFCINDVAAHMRGIWAAPTSKKDTLMLLEKPKHWNY